MVDILITGGIVYTMDSSRKVIKDGAVAVKGNKIVEVGATQMLEERYSAERVVDARAQG